jgi:hypothetical protein
VLVYDDYDGNTFVAYDRLAPQVAQYHNEEADNIARFVDQKLEQLAREAADNQIQE